MDYEYLKVRESDAILHVCIDRSDKRNALSQGVLAELKACFNAYRERDDLIAATVRGAGDKCFAAGGDLHELNDQRSRADAHRIGTDSSAALDAIRNFPLPVFGLLNGDAIGGGAELAMACDVRIAAHHARIGFLQATLNITPAWGGGSDLMRAVGSAQALSLLTRAEFVAAVAAMELGLVQALAPPDAIFEDFVNAFLRPVTERRPQVMKALKALGTAHHANASASAFRALELAGLIETWSHSDHWQAHERVMARISTPKRDD